MKRKSDKEVSDPFVRKRLKRDDSFLWWHADDLVRTVMSFLKKDRPTLITFCLASKRFFESSLIFLQERYACKNYAVPPTLLFSSEIEISHFFPPPHVERPRFQLIHWMDAMLTSTLGTTKIARKKRTKHTNKANADLMEKYLSERRSEWSFDDKMEDAFIKTCVKMGRDNQLLWWFSEKSLFFSFFRRGDGNTAKVKEFDEEGSSDFDDKSDRKTCAIMCAISNNPNPNLEDPEIGKAVEEFLREMKKRKKKSGADVPFLRSFCPGWLLVVMANMCGAFAMNGNFEMLKRLKSSGVLDENYLPWRKHANDRNFQQGSDREENFAYFMQRIWKCAALNGDVKMLKWIFKNVRFPMRHLYTGVAGHTFFLPAVYMDTTKKEKEEDKKDNDEPTDQQQQQQQQQHQQLKRLRGHFECLQWAIDEELMTIRDLKEKEFLSFFVGRHYVHEKTDAARDVRLLDLAWPIRPNHRFDSDPNKTAMSSLMRQAVCYDKPEIVKWIIGENKSKRAESIGFNVKDCFLLAAQFKSSRTLRWLSELEPDFFSTGTMTLNESFWSKTNLVAGTETHNAVVCMILWLNSSLSFSFSNDGNVDDRDENDDDEEEEEEDYGDDDDNERIFWDWIKKYYDHVEGDSKKLLSDEAFESLMRIAILKGKLRALEIATNKLASDDDRLKSLLRSKWFVKNVISKGRWKALSKIDAVICGDAYEELTKSASSTRIATYFLNRLCTFQDRLKKNPKRYWLAPCMHNVIKLNPSLTEKYVKEPMVRKLETDVTSYFKYFVRTKEENEKASCTIIRTVFEIAIGVYGGYALLERLHSLLNAEPHESLDKFVVSCAHAWSKTNKGKKLCCALIGLEDYAFIEKMMDLGLGVPCKECIEEACGTEEYETLLKWLLNACAKHWEEHCVCGWNRKAQSSKSVVYHRSMRPCVAEAVSDGFNEKRVVASLKFFEWLGAWENLKMTDPEIS